MKFRIVFVLLPLCMLQLSCTKKVGTNPLLAYTDDALLDSCLNTSHLYYNNNPSQLLPGTKGPHGSFKLRFNAIAYKALTDKGKLPEKGLMPEGAMVIKDVYDGAVLKYYAFMYKRSGNWLWGEATAKKQVLYSINKDPSVCTSCHSQQGQRDLIMSFNFY